MPLTPIALSTQIQNMSLYDNEAQAVSAWADAFTTFMGDAMCMGIPIVAPVLQTLPKTAFIASATGLSQDGSNALTNAITSFWGAMVPLAATLFPTATVITPPPTLAAIGAALTGVFQANTSGNLDKATCALNIATVIYTNCLGGTALITVPPPAPFPIL